MSDKPASRSHGPLYANLYPKMVEVARAHGYALAVHGSMSRDLDLIAVPWVERPSEPDALVKALATVSYFEHVSPPDLKLHGRLAYTLAWPGTCFVDLSVITTGRTL